MADHYCECGCGQITKPGNRFVHGHNARIEHPMIGKKHSEESRQKMQKSHSPLQVGEGHPMYGKHHSEEVRKKMSESHKGVPLSEEHRKIKGEASKKVWATISAEKKKEWVNNISKGEKGKIVSIETRNKISEVHKGKRLSPATEFKKGMKHSKEHLEYMSQLMQEMWKDPNHVKKMAKALHVTPNKPETVVMNILNDLYPNEWKFTGDFTFMINGKCPDFVNVNGQKKIIEVWGDYWHKGENPEDRANIFKPFGYRTLIIWEHELSDMAILEQKLEAFCSNIQTPPYRKEVVDNG
jgi:G:T-mismatch repair DNA endonuclease (very short patch repair protein)